MMEEKMKKNLLNKFFVLLIFVLFIGSGALSSGFSTDVFSNSTEGYDLELVEIVPMYKRDHHTNTRYLVFSCTIKNVGTEPTGRTYGFTGGIIIYNWMIIKTVVPGGCISVGPGLMPGEELAYDNGFPIHRFFPTFIRVKYSVYPYDSNTENNDAEALYLVWGNFFTTPTKFIKIKDI
jgi:hypothetical protein